MLSSSYNPSVRKNPSGRWPDGACRETAIPSPARVPSRDRCQSPRDKAAWAFVLTPSWVQTLTAAEPCFRPFEDRPCPCSCPQVQWRPDTHPWKGGGSKCVSYPLPDYPAYFHRNVASLRGLWPRLPLLSAAVGIQSQMHEWASLPLLSSRGSRGGHLPERGQAVLPAGTPCRAHTHGYSHPWIRFLQVTVKPLKPSFLACLIALRPHPGSPAHQGGAHSHP